MIMMMRIMIVMITMITRKITNIKDDDEDGGPHVKECIIF